VGVHVDHDVNRQQSAYRNKINCRRGGNQLMCIHSSDARKLISDVGNVIWQIKSRKSLLYPRADEIR
jgi:hypothetical protein